MYVPFHGTTQGFIFRSFLFRKKIKGLDRLICLHEHPVFFAVPYRHLQEDSKEIYCRQHTVHHIT